MGRALALVILAGALLRFATLDVQSLWYDEAVTAQLLRMHLTGMLHAIPNSESTPPLYYVLAWAWTHGFGTGEAGLRSLPALLGTATIPLAWLLGRRLGGDRAALAAAALVAFNPMLVWFSQEARAYALLVLLAVLGTLLWLRALQSPASTRRLLAWGVVAALALATHYYALFLVAPQGLWLLVRAPGTRERFAALAAPLAAAAALAPLAFIQRSNDTAAFITDTPLRTRLAQVPKQFLIGYDAPAEKLLTILMALIVLAGIGGLAALIAGRIAAPAQERADATRLTAVTAAAIALLLAASVGGEDHLLTRNALALLPLAAVLTGAGLAAVSRVALRPAAVAAAAACLVGVVAVVGVARDPRMQRDDWRGAVRALGDAPGGRLIVAPASGQIPLGYYIAGLQRVPADAPAPTAEIDYLSLAERRPGLLPTAPGPRDVPVIPPGFAIAGRTDGETFTVVRMRAPAPVAVPAAALTRNLDGGGPVLLTAPATP
jgi:4-amino-4-deoxy-L-arabinose transferase-like glycosyltransferase